MYDDYSTSYTAGSELAVGLFLLFWLVALVLILIITVSLWAIFKKAGKPGWAAIVPIYSQYVFSEITLGNGLFFLLYYIPYLNVVVPFIFGFTLASAFNKSKLFALGLVFLPFIFYPMLAFSSDSHYKGPFLINDYLNSNGQTSNNYYNQQNNQYYGQNNGYYNQSNGVNNSNDYYNQNNNQF